MALAVAVLGAGAVLSPKTAFASGFATARFGGGHSTASDVRVSGLYYNPAAIGLLDGHQLQLDLSFAIRTSSYLRDPSAIDDSTLTGVQGAGYDEQAAADALAGEATLTNLIVLPFAGAVTDFGDASLPLRVGAAFFVPFGGQSAWDTQPADERFPGAQDGSARWYNIEGTIRSLAGSLGAAYRIPSLGLSLGLSGTLYFSEVNTLRARNANSTDNLVASDGSLIEGRSLLDVSGVHVGLGAGVLWEALQDTLWFGASYQSQPGFGDMRLSGTLTNTFGTASPGTPTDVAFTQALPDIVRISARGRPTRDVEVRVEMDWSRWSRLSQMCLTNDSVSDMARACATNADGSLVHDDSAAEVIQVFDRDWQDTIGVKAYGSYFFHAAGLELFVGAAFDGNAIPDRTLDPSLYDMNKLTFSAGGGYRVGEHLTLNLLLTEVLYLERDTRGQAGNEALVEPSRQPANAGRYRQNIFLIQPGAEFVF